MSHTSEFLSPEFLQGYEGRRPENAGVLFEVTHLNKYAWWIEAEKRRETWTETVARVVNYSISLYQGPASIGTLKKEAELMFKKMWHLESMPAGRTMRIGGTPAGYKFPEMNFNCSFTTIKDIQSLVDSFHLSLCSVGLGFRVLPEDIERIGNFCEVVLVENEPYVYSNTGQEYSSTEFLGLQGSTPIYKLTIGDSKEGWVQALKSFLEFSHKTCAVSPLAIKWVINYNHIRPKGTRIKTAGGYAAGHKGMEEMFTRLAQTITAKKGGLNPVAAMDTQNIVGKNVVTGGNRRSAQIALGCPNDQEFIRAKYNLYTKDSNGKWSVPPELEHRKMSNNSLVFTSKPSLEKLKEVFEFLKTNGEPGFFNLEAARKRRPNCEGLNPCLTADTWINTEVGPRQINSLLNTPYQALINGTSRKATAFWSNGVKDVYRLKTREGYSLKLTADHRVLTTQGWKEAQSLIEGDMIILNNHSKFNHCWSGDGTFEEGWLIGSLIGDGTFTASNSPNGHSEADLRFWGDTKEQMAEQAFHYMKTAVAVRSDARPSRSSSPYCQVGSVGISKLAKRFGIVHYNKVQVTPEIEQASSSFYSGFLQGLFDADGSVQGNLDKGRSIRLTQANIPLLEGVQRMLLRLGIKSVLYRNRKEAGLKLMPDGKGGYKFYNCKQVSELVISKTSMLIFRKRVSFSDPHKLERLKIFTGKINKRSLYKDSFIAKFESLEYAGQEEVFDCTVEDVHRFDANGLIVHNCAEILLDDKGVCNLSTVIMPSHLHEAVGCGYYILMGDLEESVRNATRIGLRQTNVTLSLPEWDKVQKRDRLTGVSFTGWEDFCDLMNWESNVRLHPEGPAATLLNYMSYWANNEADKYAFEMRVPRPLLVTAIKPEGTISLLPTVSWGLHRAFAPYYIRRVSVSKDDPLNKALKEIGVPWEIDQREQNSTREIFLFPVKTPAKTAAYDEPATQQLKRYFLMQNVYTNHNSSCTIYVGSGYDGYEDEWEDVLNMVYNNWDNLIAVSFLPKHSLDNPPFPQMPNTACSREDYEALVSLGFMDRLPTLYEVVAKHETIKTEYYEIEAGCDGGVCPTA